MKMRGQNINEVLWDEFNIEKSKALKKVVGIAKQSHSNSQIPQGEWMKKVTDVLNISELASENNITRCPKCDYDISFDDSRGWFCCQSKCFSGNIVDLMDFIMEGKDG